MSEKLLPCPFCGHDRIYLNAPSVHHPKGCINCPACMAYMPGEAGVTELVEAWNARRVPAPTTPELSADERSYADLAASGGIFPEFYAATANKPSAWQVEWIEGGQPVRQFYPDEKTALRVKSNVESYVVGVKDPAKVTPLYVAPPVRSAAMTDEPFTVDDAWQEILDKDDRNSPEEYPEMVMLTYDEFRDYMRRAAANSPEQSTSPEIPDTSPEPDAVSATVIKAIEAWRANPATTFTPANILREFGDAILAALSRPAHAEQVISELERVLREVRRALDPALDPTALQFPTLLAQVKRALQISDNARVLARNDRGSEAQ